VEFSSEIKKYWTEKYDLDLSKEMLKVMQGFGCGMETGDFWMIMGSISVIGVIFTEVNGGKILKWRAMAKEFINRFKEKLRYIKCIDWIRNM